jgi:hypothetical protein
MVNVDSVNYGLLYSLEPDYLRHLNNEPTAHHEIQNDESSKLGTTDSSLSGILVLLVLMLMIGLGISLTTSVSSDSIAKLSGSHMTHAIKHSQEAHATRETY